MDMEHIGQRSTSRHDAPFAATTPLGPVQMYKAFPDIDYCHKPTCHTADVATPHQGAVEVTKGRVTVKYRWDHCAATPKLFAEMTGIELATGTVIRPGRDDEVNKGTPMTLNVNQGNLARWQDELGG